ncbi:MAG: hypothetical protein LUC50_04000 [Ruminococcus sp.]|nr:hypothetical protein [Ruminococcus sp.]
MSIEQYVDGYTLENVDIHRSYSLHNFFSGYIWVVIHYEVIDKSGDCLWSCSQEGGPEIGIKFKIRRIDGKWEIVDFFAQDFYESISEQIYYALPNWDLDKQGN